MISLRYRNSLPPAVARELDYLYARLRTFLAVSFNADGTLITTPAASVSEAGLPVGAIQMWGGSSAPNSNWLLCDGSAVSRSAYADLFAVLGTTYGTGDGATTFNVPDLRGKFPLGKATAGTGSTLGSTGGAIDHTHSGPSHTHTVTSGGAHTHTGPSHTHAITEQAAGTSGAASTATTGAPSATTTVQSGAGATVASSTHTHDHAHTHSVPAHDHGAMTGSGGTGATSSDGAHDHGGVTGSAGAGNTGTANPPFAVVNYIILAQ